MSIRSVLPVLGFVIAPLPLWAQDAAEIDALYDALLLDEMVEIMRDEGLAYGAEIAADMFPGRPGTEWTRQVEAIYDAERMGETLRAELAEALEGANIDPMVSFFSTEPGRTLVSLEASARRALLDDELEEAAQESAALAMADETPRIKLIEEFVTANDLVETNVVGAMNSNYAFYTALADGGAFGGEMGTEQILSDVWSQEDEIRQSTTEWVYSFLNLAYEPAEDDEIEAYIAFSESEAGQMLNQAMFDAFDVMFTDISRALGLAAALQMNSQDI